MGSRKAMTLAEILLAVGLLAVAILALVALNTGGLRLMSSGRQHLAATDLAERVLDGARELGYSRIPVPKSFPPDANSEGFPPAPYPGQQIDGYDYQISVKTQQVKNHLKSVEVKVSYGKHQRTLTRYYSD